MIFITNFYQSVTENVNFLIDAEKIIIYKDTVLHLCLVRDEIIAIHSDARKLHIQYILKSGAIIDTDYSERKVWKAIVEALDRSITKA